MPSNGFSHQLHFPLVFSCICHHPIDMLVKFCQNLFFLTLVICLYVRYPSMFTNFGRNYDAHVSSGQKKSQIPFRLLKSSKNPSFHSQQLPQANMVMSLTKSTYVRSYDFFKTSYNQTYYALHSCNTPVSQTEA